MIAIEEASKQPVDNQDAANKNVSVVKKRSAPVSLDLPHRRKGILAASPDYQIPDR